MGAEKKRLKARGKVAGQPSTRKNVVRIGDRPKPVIADLNALVLLASLPRRQG